MNKKISAGTRSDPWTLKTPPGTSEFQAYRDESSDPPALVVQMGRRSYVITYVALRICTGC